MGSVDWTNENVTTLTQMCGQYSATVIANQIPGATRNAVIGKAHRLGLALRQPLVGVRSTGQHGKSNATHKGTRMNKLFTAAIEEIEETEPVEYLQLRERHCRALLDKRGSDGLLLSCGKTRAKENGSYISSYCPHHDRLYSPGRYAPKHGGYADGKIGQGY